MTVNQQLLCQFITYHQLYQDHRTPRLSSTRSFQQSGIGDIDFSTGYHFLKKTEKSVSASACSVVVTLQSGQCGRVKSTDGRARFSGFINSIAGEPKG